MPNRFAASVILVLSALPALVGGAGGLTGAAWAEQPPAAVAPVAPSAAAPADVAQLTGTLMIGPMIDILRDEGLEYGRTLDSQMFTDRGGARWEGAVARIYDAAKMRQVFDAALVGALAQDPEAVAAAQAFFGGALGQRILSLEIEARRTLMDDAAGDAARLRFEEMEAADDPRLREIRRFAEVNDLIGANVVGALNSNLAFFQGMDDAGLPDGRMSQEDMLAQVWQQEDTVRADTEAWMFPYLTLAYSALTDEELASYIAFSETREGKRLNTAMFTAFDRVFVAVSRDLGRAAARQLQGQDI